MADACTADMDVKSPQSIFSSFAPKSLSCNYKKHFISVYNKEENPLSPTKEDQQIPKPMPPLEPLTDDDTPCSPGSVSVHPKKRLKREYNDPMLAESAASPFSTSDLYSPISLHGRCEDVDVMLRSPTSDYLGNSPSFTRLNSLYNSSQLPLDTDTLTDSAYSSCSTLSPTNNPFSPGPTNQIASPAELFLPERTLPIPTRQLPPAPPLLSPQAKGQYRLPPIKCEQEPLVQKHCPRPESVALDLSSLPKEKPHFTFPDYRDLPEHYQWITSPSSPLSPISKVHNEVSRLDERQNSYALQYTGIVSNYNPLQLAKFRSDRPTGVIPYNIEPMKTLYNQVNLHGHATAPKPQRIHKVGGLIRPKPTHVSQIQRMNPLTHQNPYRPPHLMFHHHAGNPTKRLSTEMIANNQPMYPREIQNVVKAPTASKKVWPWLHGNDPPGAPDNPISINNNNNNNVPQKDFDYKYKPIETWGHKEIMYYMFGAIHEMGIKVFDLDSKALDGLTGRDLLHMNVEDFKRFVPETAEVMYRHFRNKVEEERRHLHQAAAYVAAPHQERHQETHQINRLSQAEVPSFDFLGQPDNYFNAIAHNHQQTHHITVRDPTVCDARAPYEIRYETGDGRHMGMDVLPSASGKTFGLLHAPSPIPFNADGNVSDPDKSSNEEEVKPDPPKKRGPGRPRKPENELKKKKKKTGRLWEFIRNLLLNPETCPSLVRWEDPEDGVFRFVQADKVAQRWGERKKNKEMNYEKLSRAMRYYYKGEVFEAVLGRRLVYKFGKNAKHWRPENPNFTNLGPFPHSSSQ